MNFLINQAQFSAMIKRVISAVETRNTIPILANVLIKANDGAVSITATDMDIEITTTEAAQVNSNGETTVSAGLLNDILSKVKKGADIQFHVDDYAWLKSGKSNLKLKVLPPEDFPRIASTEYSASFTAPQSSIKTLFDQSAFAVSTEETRYQLNGVYLHSVNGNVRAVATDGHRLAQVDSSIASEFPSVIVPRKTVGIISKLDADCDCVVSVSETKIKFDLGDTVIVSKVIDGSFPDYTRVIPERGNDSVRFAASDAKQAIALVTTVATDRTKTVALDIGADGLTFMVQGSALGEGVETIEAELRGEYIKIGVNGKYALAALEQADDGNVTIEYSTPMSPMRVTYEAFPDLLCVIMPTRV